MKYKCSKCQLVQECNFGDLLTTQCKQCGQIISQFTDIHDEIPQDPIPANSRRVKDFNYLIIKKWVVILGLVILFLICAFFLIQYIDSQVGSAKNVVVAPTLQLNEGVPENRDAQLLSSIVIAAPKISVGKEMIEITEVLSTDIPKTPYPIIKVSFCSEATCTKENTLKEIDFEDYPRHVPDYLIQDIITLKISKTDVPVAAKGVGINLYYKKKEQQ